MQNSGADDPHHQGGQGTGGRQLVLGHEGEPAPQFGKGLGRQLFIDADDKVSRHLLFGEAVHGMNGLPEEVPFIGAGWATGQVPLEDTGRFRRDFIINKIGELVLAVDAIHSEFMV